MMPFCCFPLVTLTVGVLVYRVFRNESKRSVKILHALIHMMALIISIVGKSCLHITTHINKPFSMCQAYLLFLITCSSSRYWMWLQNNVAVCHVFQVWLPCLMSTITPASLTWPLFIAGVACLPSSSFSCRWAHTWTPERSYPCSPTLSYPKTWASLSRPHTWTSSSYLFFFCPYLHLDFPHTWSRWLTCLGLPVLLPISYLAFLSLTTPELFLAYTPSLSVPHLSYGSPGLSVLTYSLIVSYTWTTH